MKDDQFEDLKQFIDSRISQSEFRSDEKFGKITKQISQLKSEMLDGFSGVGDAIEDIHKLLEETKINFEKRISKLEIQANH